MPVARLRIFSGEGAYETGANRGWMSILDNLQGFLKLRFQRNIFYIKIK